MPEIRWLLIEASDIRYARGAAYGEFNYSTRHCVGCIKIGIRFAVSSLPFLCRRFSDFVRVATVHVRFYPRFVVIFSIQLNCAVNLHGLLKPFIVVACSEYNFLWRT
jgi:hypothetical protein